MNPDQVWLEFIQELGQGDLPLSKFRPYQPSILAPLSTVLNHLRLNVIRVAAEKTHPECVISGNQYNFILSLGNETSDFCFSFLVENEQWYLQHIETVFIRLDQVGPFPASIFPDLPEETKAWCRDELHISEMVRLYHFLSVEKGTEFALDWFRDGKTYFLGSRAWVPFISPSKAFILYVCWEWANLQNNQVTLVCLDDAKAIIRARLRWFELYHRATHLQQQIPEKEYFELFESIWMDRSKTAGWNLQITSEKEDFIFTFTKLA
jgi:hypothetical protein